MAAPVFVPDEVVTAAKMNSLPKGILGIAQLTALSQGSITAEADIIGLAVTVTVEAGRRLRITCKWNITNGTAGANNLIRIKEDSTVLGRSDVSAPGSNMHGGMVQAFPTPSAGAHTYKVSAQAVTGSLTFTGTTDGRSAVILVEDIGAV